VLKLYYGSGSPYAWRVQLGLEHKALPYERILLSFAKGDLKTPEHLARNPRGKIPVLVDDDFALYESGAILEYLDEAYPGRGRPLFPGDAKARAIQRRVILETNDYLDKAADPLSTQAFSVKPEERDASVIAAAREATKAELAHLARGLAGDFFGGDAPGAADFTLYTLLGFLRRCEEQKLPQIALADLLGDRLGRWMERIDNLPFADACIPPHWKAAA
jgi:glutathione S-transferase